MNHYDVPIGERQIREGYFYVTCISRGDLEQLGFETSHISDEHMAILADKMADDYLDNFTGVRWRFWRSS